MKAMNAYLNSATEAQIQKAICGYLAANRIFFSVTDAGLYFVNGKPRRKVQADGYPDITAILDGKFIGIEVKSHSGKLRPSQVECHKRIREAGGCVIVARCVEDVSEIVEVRK